MSAVTSSNHVRRTLLVSLVAALVVLSSLAVTSTGARAGASKTISGCGAATPGTTTLSLNIGGHTRPVYVHVPRGSSDTTPLALVLNLHGSGTTALDQVLFTGMNVASNHDGFIVAYPQGLIPDGTGYDWNVPGVPLTGGRAVPAGAANDVEFLTKLVGVLELKYCVNKDEVYATGFSGGARMVSQLACSDATIFAAVAPVSGLRHPKPCTTSRAVPIISLHGTSDPVDPFGGHGQAYWTYSVPTAAKDWATQDGCSTKAVSSRPDANVTLLTYSRCANGAEVELYEIAGEGHEWPGGPTMPTSIVSLLGPQSTAINADATMWSFFSAHRL